MDPTAGGIGWVIMSVIGFAVLGLALAYGTMRWSGKRKMRAPGTVERAPGPAPQGTVSGPDDRRAV